MLKTKVTVCLSHTIFENKNMTVPDKRCEKKSKMKTAKKASK